MAAPRYEDFENEKVLLSWEAEERLVQRKSRDFYSTVMVLAILVAIVFFFIEGIMPVLVVGAIVFVVFALTKTEPDRVKNVITERQIMTGTEKFPWGELINYWIEDKGDRKVLSVLTTRRFPAQLILVLPKDGEVDDKKVRQVVGQYLPWERPEETRLDRMVKWLGEKVPLE